MCIRSYSLKVAETDIVCYKQLCRSELFGFLYTPVVRRLMFPWVLSGKRLYRARGFKRIECLEDYTFWVDSGFVYSYARGDDVFDDGKLYVAYECVIPAGTRYWMSTDAMVYASDKIRFKRRLKLEED